MRRPAQQIRQGSIVTLRSTMQECPQRSGQQTENCHAAGCSNVDLPVDNHRRDEFVARSKAIPVTGCLCAVVELLGKICSVISMKDSRRTGAALQRPYDATG